MSQALFLDLYELTMSESYFRHKPGAWATFELFVRQLPPQRDYLVACGLEDILEHIKGIKFSQDDLEFLKKQKLFSDEFLKYLGNFKFRGDVWAMPEGTIFFAQEPIIRVTAPIIHAQLIEGFLLNTVNLQTMVASKASRVANAADGRAIFDFSLRRTHGFDAAIKAARSAYIAGAKGTSNVLAAKLYDIPAAGTMAHSYVMSFKREMESFLAYSTAFPKKTILLIDTYDSKKGIRNAVRIGIFLKEQGYKLLGIRLDSADIAGLSKFARAQLNKAGLKQVKIFASGNLDEYRIKALLDKGAKIDNFGVGTNMGASVDAPSLDVVYKICEITNGQGAFLPTMKLSMAKASYPGRKQVFRLRDKQGKFIRDVLGLEKEKVKGERLLIKAVNKGRVIYKPPALKQVRRFLRNNLKKFPRGLKDIGAKYRYPVFISPQLDKLRRDLSAQLKGRQ